MKKSIKLVSLMLVVALYGSLLLAGCGGSGSSSTEEKSTQSPNTISAEATTTKTAEPKLEKETLVAYLLGAAPADGPAVMEAVNTKLQNDINTTLSLQYIPFGDIATKYPLVLASGEDWDIIYGNVNYSQNAAKGGYREITLDEVQNFAPLTFKATTKEQWADTLVNGKIFMIPQSFKELDVGGWFYREDLRKKFNVPEIKTATDFVAYLQTLKKNGITPTDGTSEDVQGIFNELLSQEYSYFRVKAQGDLVNINPDDLTYTTKGLLDAEFVEHYKKAALTVRKLYEEGVIPKNAYANKVRAIDLFKTEKTATWNNAFENYPQYVTDTKAKGWEVGFFGGVTNKGSAMLRPASGNGYSLSPSSKKFSRALATIDLLNQDPSYNMLISFGIENKNYVLKDGKLDLAPGIDPANNPYPMYGAGFWANNRDQWPPLANYTQSYIDAKKNLQDHGVSYLLNGFNAVDDSIKTELANIVNVHAQYAMPIKLGLVKDVDKAVDTLIEKLKAAGAEKVVAEYKKQIAEFVAAH